MPLSDKSNHLNSDQDKNKTKQLPIWCEDCGNYISDKIGYFQSEFHTLGSQNHQISQNTRSVSGMQSGVERIVKEKTYIKLKVNPTENLENRFMIC